MRPAEVQSLEEGLESFYGSVEQGLSVVERLRWVTLGRQYDWSSRSLSGQKRQGFHQVLARKSNKQSMKTMRIHLKSTLK